MLTKYIKILVLALLALNFGVASAALANGGGGDDDSIGPACALEAEEGRTIVLFDSSSNKIISNSNESRAFSGPVSVSLPAGNYKVTLVSFDGYEERANAVQPHESWFAILKSGEETVAASSATSDLADGVAYVSLDEVVDEVLEVSSAVDSVTAYHAAYPDNSNPNSVLPVCAAFDFMEEENTPPVITLLGANPLELTQGDVFEDPGATAHDEEDGEVEVVVAGDEVSTSTPGTYIITYNAVDSEGAEAEEVTRTVNVNLPEVEEEEEEEEDNNEEEGEEGGEGNQPPVNAGGGGSALPECNDGIDNDGDTLIDYPEPGCDSPEDDDESGGAVINGGGGNGPVGPIGPTAPQIPAQESDSQGEVLGEFTSCGKYLDDYIKFGEDNNPFEVRKLQRFLNEYEGENLEVTGVYNGATLEAVNRFQLKYAVEVLAPWLPYGHEDLETPTGYVYKTTQRWINMIVCESLNLAVPDLNEDGAKWGITYDTDAELFQAQLIALLAEHQRIAHKLERVSP